MAGRKPQHYIDPRTNRQIEGLARRSDGRWRVIATGQTFVEPDIDLAIHRYRTQYARRSRQQVRVPTGRMVHPPGADEPWPP